MRGFTVIDDALFFTVNSVEHGNELWRSDGTEAGTFMVRDIWPGANSSGLFGLTNIGGTLYFTANDGVHGEELWLSDGTYEGTELVADFTGGSSGGGSPRQITAVGNTIFVTATSEDYGTELYGWIQDSNQAPIATDLSFDVAENTLNGAIIGTVSASDPDGDPLTYSIRSGNELGAFAVDAATGQVTVANSTRLDYESDAIPKNFALTLEVDDGRGGSVTSTITLYLINLPSITGAVYVDVNQDGVFQANEPGIDGVMIELLNAQGDAVLDAHGAAIRAITSDGGFYLLEDLAPATYQLHELQPSGVGDGLEQLGSLGGIIVEDDIMQVMVDQTDAFDYAFAEYGGQIGSGQSAGIGFWQNKHGQQLIAASGNDLATWLSSNFGNVFGNSLMEASGQEVADFYREQLFSQKSSKSFGPAKVDAQFMATALNVYFTNRQLAGEVGTSYGFTVSDTGLGVRVVNIGSRGSAFGVGDGSNQTVMQLLLATNSLTDIDDNRKGFASIYDLNGDGILDDEEIRIRIMAGELYAMINDQ